MIELDSKVYAIDNMLNKIQVLRTLIIKGEMHQEVAGTITELKAISLEAGINCIPVLEYIEALSSGDEPQQTALITTTIEKLVQIIQKEYVALIHNENTYRKVLLDNYYQTENSKNVLIMYIVYPFLFPDAGQGHTNQVEVKIMAEVFRENGFNVDIVNTRYEGVVDITKYDVIIGSGKRFEELVKRVKSAEKDIKTICYLTESSPYFSNQAELARLRDFEKRNHYLPKPERMTEMLLDLSVLLQVDAAICLGNECTRNTYDNMFSEICSINVSGFSNITLDKMNRTSDARKNFMWYGGMGPIHKGLDLCIEAFRELPDLNLHIVGGVTQEFYEFYKDDIENGENIFFYDFLSKDNLLFEDACNQCGFALMPSCSEGQSTSMLTTMFAGMIPIGTPENGIDITDNGGVLLSSIDIPYIRKVVSEASKMDVVEFESRQKRVFDYVMNHHTPSHYRESLNKIIAKIN